MVFQGANISLANLVVRSTLLEKIKVAQNRENYIQKTQQEVKEGDHQVEVKVHEDHFIKFGDQFCVQGNLKLNKETIEKAYFSSY